MLPQWFAEYTLYLGLAGVVFCVAVIAFGYAGASTNHFTGLLSDMRQTRRPSAALAVVAGVAGGLMILLALSSGTSHLGLALYGFGSLFVLVAIAAGGMLPIKRLWTNEYWRLPAPQTLTFNGVHALARTMGRVYAVVGIGCLIAMAGALLGMVPKLAYVGEQPTPFMFLVAGIALIVVGAAVLFRVWKLFHSLQVRRTSTQIQIRLSQSHDRPHPPEPPKGR
jgi:MFS family permease